MKIFNTESTWDAVFKNTLISFFAKLLTYVNYALIAYIFGAQVSTDIYYLGVSFTAACTGVFVIVFSSVFSPILIRIKLQSSMNEARSFAGSIFGFMLVPLVFISLGIFFGAVETFELVSRFPLKSLVGNSLMLRFFPFVIMLTVLTEFGRVYIQSLGYFSVVALFALVQSILLISLMLLTVASFDANSLVVALSSSLLVQVVLIFTFCWRKGIMPILNLAPNKLHRELIQTSVPLLLAHTVSLFVAYFLDYLASGLEAGSLTAITFAQRLYLLPTIILFNPILEIVNTRFANYYHTDREQLLRRFIELQRAFIIIFAPVMVLMISFRLEIVELFFMRGAFRMSDVILTANSLGVYALNIMSYCLLLIISRVYFVMQKTGWTSLYGTFGQIGTVLVAVFAVQRLGYIGIPVAKASVELLYLVPVSFWLVGKYLVGFSVKTLVTPAVASISFCAVLGVLVVVGKDAVYDFSFFLSGNGTVSNLATIGLISLAYLSIYCFGLYKAGNREIRYVLDKVNEFQRAR